MPQKSFFEILAEVSPFIGVAGLCGLYAAARRGWNGWKDLALSVAGSALCGGIVGWLLMGVNASPYAVGAVCGIAGLLGDRGLQAMQKSLLKRLDKEVSMAMKQEDGDE